jgi:hypothetical protein
MIEISNKSFNLGIEYLERIDILEVTIENGIELLNININNDNNNNNNNNLKLNNENNIIINNNLNNNNLNNIENNNNNENNLNYLNNTNNFYLNGYLLLLKILFKNKKFKKILQIYNEKILNEINNFEKKLYLKYKYDIELNIIISKTYFELNDLIKSEILFKEILLKDEKNIDSLRGLGLIIYN